MTWRWASGALLLLGAAPLGAQQRIRELGVGATVLASAPAVVLGGVYAAVRSSSRTRFALTAAAGGAGGSFAWRGELLGHFLLSPGRRTGAGLYAGGGVAAQGVGSHEQGYVVVLLGLEARPGARSGWAVEAGLGGGFRASVGWRWRMGGRK